MENRHITIIAGNKEYYLEATRYLIRGRLIFIHNAAGDGGEKILLKTNTLADIRFRRGVKKALVMAASAKEYVLFFRNNAEDEIREDLDEFDRILRRNGKVYGEYVYDDEALE